jgi:hypothetical protein
MMIRTVLYFLCIVTRQVNARAKQIFVPAQQGDERLKRMEEQSDQREVNQEEASCRTTQLREP